jgi:acyl-coenzyme A synthetase/AMP-(fatty) acid ligase
MFYQDKIFKKLEGFKNKIALISENNQKLTYSELIQNVNNIIRYLEDKKKLIFLLGQNNFESIIGYLSFIKKGYTVVFLDFKINDYFLKKLISIYDPDYIFSEKHKLKNLKSFVYILDQNSYRLYKRKFTKELPLNKDLMLMMTTSGSTGSPKFVRQSYENVASNTDSIIKYLNIKKSDVTITSLPISYVYGLSIINTHLFRGSTIVMTNKSIVENVFWNLVNKYRVSSFGGVPFQYNVIEKIFNKSVPRSLKYTTQAGGKMNHILLKNIINIYKKNKINFIQMYGAAEATSRMSYLKWKDVNKLGSIGKPIPGGKFYIIGKNGKKINKIHQKGELVFEGKNVCMGYAKSLKDLSLPNVNKGLLKTGDIAYKDNQGFYYIEGRKDRYAKIYGARVNLSELEEILLKKGIDVIMKEGGENKIYSYFKNLKDLKKGIKYISQLTSINSKVFEGKILLIKSLMRNYKYKI